MDQSLNPRNNPHFKDMFNSIHNRINGHGDEHQLVYQKLLDEIRRKNPNLDGLALHHMASGLMQQQQTRDAQFGLEFMKATNQSRMTY